MQNTAIDNFNRFLRDFRVFFTISRQFFVYFLEQLETFHAFAKDDVFAVALLRRAERDEALHRDCRLAAVQCGHVPHPRLQGGGDVARLGARAATE